MLVCIIKTVVAVSIFDFRRLRIRNIFFQIVQTMVKIDFEAEGDSHMVQQRAHQLQFMKTDCSGINAVSLGTSGQPQKISTSSELIAKQIQIITLCMVDPVFTYMVQIQRQTNTTFPFKLHLNLANEKLLERLCEFY